MATGVSVWSKTASSNNTADSAVNWQEGQAPSSVNDSARGMMAATAKWRDDLNGSLVLGGTSSAYTLTTNQGFSALAAGLQVAFQVNVSNALNPTIAVDGLAAKPIRSSPGSGLWANFFLAGGVYRLTYFTSNSGEWIIDSYPYLGDLQVDSAKLAANAVTTAKITDANVTYAKIQNVTNNRMLGNTSGGSAAPSEQTITQILDMVGSAANGDILIRSGGVWTRLAKATDGNILVLASGVPAWGTSNFEKLATVTASNQAAVSFTSLIDSTYREYVFEFDNLLPASTTVTLLCEVSDDAGSSWKSSSYASVVFVSNNSGGTAAVAASANIQITQTGDVVNSSGYGVTGSVVLRTPSGSNRKIVSGQVGYRNSASGISQTQASGYWDGSGAINAIRFRFSSGNVSSGVVTMYGIK